MRSAASISKRASRAVIEPLEDRRLLAAVSVSLNDVNQTIGGIGGNFARGRFDGLNVVQDTVGNYMLAHSPPDHARIGIPLQGWEPSNDDNNASNFNWNGFVDTGNVHNVFLMLKDFKQRGIPMTASVWDAPNWMVSNPDAVTQRNLGSGKTIEFIESITAFLIRARDTYGVTFDYVSLNEANGGINLSVTPAAMVNLIKQSGPIFAANNLNVKWLVGDVSNAIDALPYITPILQDSGTAPYTGPISFHSWDSTSADSVLTGIADIAAQYNKEVWCEELGYDAYLWQLPTAPWPTWDYAAKTNKILNRVLRLSKASTVDYWQFQEDYEPVNKQNSTPYPVYYLIKQIQDNLTPGTEVLAVTTNDSNVLPLAVKNADQNRFMIQLQNLSASSKSVTITGLPDELLTLVRSSSTENSKTINGYTPVNGSLTITLAADSVSTFTGELPMPPTEGKIAGTVFNDVNSNSIFEAAEPGLSNWTVYLDSNNNNFLDDGEISTSTDAVGQYEFAGLAPATYYVRQIAQSGYRRSLPAPPVNAFTINLAAGQVASANDFGNTTNILITGRVFADTNSDGIQNNGETGIFGRVVFVDLNENGSVDAGEPNRTTDGNGNFQFKGLAAGTGTLRPDITDGFIVTFPGIGYHSGTVSAGQVIPNANFGLLQPASPSPLAANVLLANSSRKIWSSGLLDDLRI